MNRKQLFFVIAVGIAVSIILGGGILLLASNDVSEEVGLRIVTTFYPLYYLAGQIGGDRISVSMLIPENMEPHAWEPKVSDILKIDRADIFIYNGGGFEPWVGDFLGSSLNKDLVTIDTSTGMELNSSKDPHFWLDPLMAKMQIENILDGMEKADPVNAPFFKTNALALKAKLDELDHAFESGLRNRTKNDIITTHEGFDYLADRYGFQTHAAVGITGDQQPSVQDMADLVKAMKDLDLNYVFVEPAFSDKYMDAISSETGADILILDGLHGRMGIHSDLDYFQIMYENLINLELGLEVKGDAS